MRKIIIFVSLLLVAIIAIAALYFSNLHRESRNSDKILSYLPLDASIVLEFRNDKSFREIFKGYQLFKNILGEEKIQQVNQLQSFLNSSSSNSQDGYTTFLSLHHSANADIELLWMLVFDNIQRKDKISEALFAKSSKNKSRIIKIAGQDVVEFIVQDGNMPFYLFVESGSCIGSYSKNLIKQCLDPNVKKADAKFIDEIAAPVNNENSLLNIFINHNTIPTFLLRYFNGALSGNLALLNQLRGTSRLSMNFKSNALMFNGLAITDTASTNYLNLFKDQKPVKTSIIKSMPASTANYIAFGISDYPKFNKQLNSLLHKRNELKKLQNQFAIVKATSTIDVDGDIKRFLSDEFAVLQLSGQQRLAVIKLTNGSRMANVLGLISRKYSDDIFEFNNANVLYYCFGDPMRNFPRPYYTIIDNYIILANSPSNLQQFLYDYNNDKRLVNSSNFIEFNQYIANQSSISLFINIKNSKALINSTLKKPFANNFKDDTFGLDKFYGLSYQWSADGEHFFTNFYASLNDTTLAQTITEKANEN